MKTVEIEINGDSLLAYVSFYDKSILKKLQKIDEGDFDFVDFCSQNQKESKFIGRGFDVDSAEFSLKIDGIEIYSGKALCNECYDDDHSVIGEEFEKQHGRQFDSSLSFSDKKIIESDLYFFNNVNKFSYCSIETVECYNSRDLLTIHVDDSFKMSDIEVVVVSIDSGDDGSIAQHVYSQTDLENQIVGVNYKNKFFEFKGGNDEGGANELHWFENDGEGNWDESEDLSEIIESLE